VAGVYIVWASLCPGMLQALWTAAVETGKDSPCRWAPGVGSRSPTVISPQATGAGGNPAQKDRRLSRRLEDGGGGQEMEGVEGVGGRSSFSPCVLNSGLAGLSAGCLLWRGLWLTPSCLA
jgi:hypothetical protein